MFYGENHKNHINKLYCQKCRVCSGALDGTYSIVATGLQKVKMPCLLYLLLTSNS